MHYLTEDENYLFYFMLHSSETGNSLFKSEYKNSDSEVKIADNVMSYAVAENGESIYYINNKGELYYPVFTDGAELKKCSEEPDQRVLIVNFADLAAMIAAQNNQISGFVINPRGDNMVFPAEMIAKMSEEMMREDKEKEK